MKPYITAEEVIEKQGENQRTYRFLTTENGCVNGCASGTTIYANTEFSDHPGAHDDQEGFYVLEGEGLDRKSTRLNSSHSSQSRMPSSA